MRPMLKMGNLLKGIFNPNKTNYFWIRVKDNANTKEEKDNFIFATIELLNERIQINGQNTKH